MLESVDDRVLEKENVSWNQLLTYICGQRDSEYIVDWEAMKWWLEECRFGEEWIWN